MMISWPVRSALAAVILLPGLALHAGPAFADKRVALVIGNGAYQNAAPLPNPPNDARDVGAALTRAGFETIVGIDLDRAGMDKAAISFTRAARDADVAVFYYSGHALQFAGVNYLMPVDARLTDEADLRLMSRVDDVVADLQQAKNLRILVLDACRDNPFAEALKRSIGRTRSASVGNGLAKIDSPQGMIVAYATQAGHTAEDGSGRNSPYTSAFLKYIETPEEIGTVFRRISADVYDTTRRTQLPELSLSLIGEFYLKGRSSAASAAPAKSDDVSALEQRLKNLEEQLKARDEPKAALAAPPARMSPPVVAAPAALPPANGTYDPVGATTAFYTALSEANGRSAVALVVPEKRGAGHYVEANINKFYSSLREPLKILSVERIDADHVGVKYSFVRPGGSTCAGEAKVNTIFQNGKTFIKGIASNC
jgi:Caspase domain